MVDKNLKSDQFDKFIKQAHNSLQKNFVQEAIYHFTNALSVKPDDPLINNNLGVLFFRLGNYVLAKMYLEKAVSLNADYFDAAFNLVKVYQKLNDPDKANFHLQKCLLLQPDNHKVIELSQTLNNQTKDVRKPDNQQISPNISPLKILFVQESPCIRNYKMATALRSRGHSVSLAYTKYRLSEMYPGLDDNVYNRCYHIKSFPQLWDLAENFDIIHCHNEPDVLTVAALAGKTPVIHDTHDLISLRADGDANLIYFEGVANRGAAGRVYVTPYLLQTAQKMYGVQGPSIVFYNYASRADLPSEFLPKLSTTDGLVHIVYEGGIGGDRHRDFIALFNDLAKNDIHIHVYPSFYNEQLADYFSSNKNIHYYRPCSPKMIMRQMTQYDLGIIPFNLEKGNKQFLDTSLANKLFEYLAAGLPVLTSSLKSYNDFFNEYPVGLSFENIDDIIEKIPQLLENSKKIDYTKYIFTYESQVPLLEELYLRVLEQYNTGNRTDVHDSGKTEIVRQLLIEKTRIVPDECAC